MLLMSYLCLLVDTASSALRSSLDSSFTGSELFKHGSVTPAMSQQLIRGGGARPPLLSFDNSKGFGTLSFGDTPAAVLNFSSSTPQLSTAHTKHDKPKSNLSVSCTHAYMYSLIKVA